MVISLAKDTTEKLSLSERVDFLRLDAGRSLQPDRRAELGQFLTPAPVARLLAGLFDPMPRAVRLLDPGAGVGSLTAAFVEEACRISKKPESIHVVAFEIDRALAEVLKTTLQLCETHCRQTGVGFTHEIIVEDFIDVGAVAINGSLVQRPLERFTHCIMNPPYRKIQSQSKERKRLRELGIETGNLYSGFVSIATRLMAAGGELVAITPRSFCNGTYFTPFRKDVLGSLALRRIHVFESRGRAFKDDAVLQENVIFHGKRSGTSPADIVLSSSTDADLGDLTLRTVPFKALVHPGDEHSFLHLETDEYAAAVTDRLTGLECSLADLKIQVSTGRVVDFRAKDQLRLSPTRTTAPLLFPMHFKDGFIQWPKLNAKKPNAIEMDSETASLFVPNEVYVLVKRFSAKEEKRRIVAAVSLPEAVSGKKLGIENHLNYFHQEGRGLPRDLAKGLAVFLNSTLVDSYFRQFSGHTQVNAADLKKFKYPTRKQLTRLGGKIKGSFPQQNELDHLVEQELFPMAEKNGKKDPIKAKKRIDEALEILRLLEMPRAQLNERSALTLLALLDLKPHTPWAEAQVPLRGITEMMDFFKEHYGKEYAPNTRETVRRFTVHQFLQAGLVVINPDKPTRPTNSPKSVYKIETSLLAVFRLHGAPSWEKNLKVYLLGRESLVKKYARERTMIKIPVKTQEGQTINLSPGGQNVLVQRIVEEFCPRYVPGGHLIHIGDTQNKWAYFDEPALKALGVTVNEHGKMPDVVIHHVEKNWLLLIEAVTSHGPVNAKRRDELEHLFKGCSAGLVFVTAFMDRKAMLRYLDDISWETEVWVAESPSHMIHFNGDRFLGPY
jgi:adenine-specific DNA-methyltransferase